MTAPKNDKARKEWLAGLKTGDLVAVIDDAGALLDVFKVTRRDVCEDFWVSCWGSFTLKTGRGKGKSGGARGGTWLAQVTDEMRARHESRQAAGRARDRLSGIDPIGGWRMFSDEQVVSAAAILWPESGKDSK